MRISIPFSLVVTTIILAFCSIVYELILAQSLTLIFGSSVMQYSLTIGIYLFALGIGAICFRFLNEEIEKQFVILEVVLSLIGAISVFFLFFIATWQIQFPIIIKIISYFLVFLIGVLSGLEMPLLNALAKSRANFSEILSFDYLGSLIGSICFPLILYPYLGLFSTAILIATINMVIAICFIRKEIASRLFKAFITLSLIVFLCLAFFHTSLQNYIEKMYINNYIVRQYFWGMGDTKPIRKVEIVDHFQTLYQSKTE